MVNSSVERPINPRASQTMAVQCARCGHLASQLNGPQCFFCGAALSSSGAAPIHPPARHDVALAATRAASATPAVSYRPQASRMAAHEVVAPPPAAPHSGPPPAQRPAAQRPAAQRERNPFAGAALLLGLTAVGITVAAAAIGYYVFGYFSVYAVLIALRGVVQGISIRPHRGMLVSLLGLILSGLALAATLLMAEGQIVIYY